MNDFLYFEWFPYAKNKKKKNPPIIERIFFLPICVHNEKEKKRIVKPIIYQLDVSA